MIQGKMEDTVGISPFFHSDTCRSEPVLAQVAETVVRESTALNWLRVWKVEYFIGYFAGLVGL